MAVIIIVAVCAFLVVVGIILLFSWLSDFFEQRQEKAIKNAGIFGEDQAYHLLQSVLTNQDKLFRNIHVHIGPEAAEIDFLVVNKSGVFVIEVKNYSGTLYGGETDFMWRKSHISRGDNVYFKTVKNPIRQVRRQSSLLGQFLRKNGIRVWVTECVFLAQNNSPVNSPIVLHDMADFKKRLHTTADVSLSAETVENICHIIDHLQKDNLPE